MSICENLLSKYNFGHVFHGFIFVNEKTTGNIFPEKLKQNSFFLPFHVDLVLLIEIPEIFLKVFFANLDKH